MRSTYELRLPAAPRARLGGIVLRSVVAAILMGALSFFVTLALAIAYVAVFGLLLQVVHSDIRIVYRELAPAVAVTVAPVAFAANFLWELARPRSSTRT